MRSPEQFARAVEVMAENFGLVMMGAQMPGRAHPMLCWPEMADPQWREAALTAVNAKTVVRDATFCEPNEVNDWIFKARRRLVA